MVVLSYFYLGLGLSKDKKISSRHVRALFEKRGGGCLSFSKDHGKILFQALSELPLEVCEWAIEKLIFLSSLEGYNAYIINMPELVKRGKIGIVLLCDLLKYQTKEVQSMTIAHEIAHAWLHHATTFQDLAAMQICEEADEKEADKLANEWLHTGIGNIR